MRSSLKQAAKDAPGSDCLIVDGLEMADARRLAYAIRLTKPLGSFTASIRSVGLPDQIKPAAVFGQYHGEPT